MTREKEQATCLARLLRDSGIDPDLLIHVEPALLIGSAAEGRHESSTDHTTAVPVDRPNVSLPLTHLSAARSSVASRIEPSTSEIVPLLLLESPTTRLDDLIAEEDSNALVVRHSAATYEWQKQDHEVNSTLQQGTFQALDVLDELQRDLRIQRRALEQLSAYRLAHGV